MAKRLTLQASLIDEYISKYRNWGRWGPNDQLGTVNFITPDVIKHAATLVRQGKVIHCGLPFDKNGPQTGKFGRVNPIFSMLATGTDVVSGKQKIPGFEGLPLGIGYADDQITFALQSGTQWDGLSHIFHNGQMWNGYSGAYVTASGAELNGIQNYRNKIVTRGVLLDIARYRGVEALEPGEPIYPEDLDGAAKQVGVEVRSGDIVLVNTGEMARRLKEGDWGSYSAGDAPGLSLTCSPWVYEKEIAGLATDTWGVEVRPNEIEGAFQPMHIVVLVNMGLLMGEIFYLKELVDDCKADGVYEFMFVAPPLNITGAVGSPLNPQAIK
jgi:kynurenine formamidase